MTSGRCGSRWLLLSGLGFLLLLSSPRAASCAEVQEGEGGRRLLEGPSDGAGVTGRGRQGKVIFDTKVPGKPESGDDGVARAAAGDGGGGSGGGADVALPALVAPQQGLADAFMSSLGMILVTEIGDETFIIAALMAMRHSRGIVLAGALSALYIMTVLSTGLGLIVPNLISRKATQGAATVLYTFFGLRLLYIAWRANPHDTPQKEMEEVEEKLEGDEKGNGKGRMRRALGRIVTPVFLEAFILTFLAEWGDRSQIATIALAAHKNPIGVTIGASLGHTFCTTLAVVGGRLLALKISQRTVASIGGFLFLVFAVHSYFTAPW